MLNIVLVEPEIPQNTGNIARTCSVTGARLHLVKPLGFEVTDKQLKRAGMDYWYDVDITYYDNLQDFLEKHEEDELFFLSTKSKQNHTEIKYPEDAYLLFGKESKGLPEWLLLQNMNRCVRIPMRENIRSLNLSNSVAIAAYEYYRQRDFKDLQSVSPYFNE
ncbi:MAG: tRNA (uridine(34)/cytosine(34)/5-carboxymethylaminomethyluridine(34)-2'-O)-methyltransferase TrmL [Clostridiales bacterium]|nr:tRNA (uridine(34)/cytosine(34)/5-carboxymethylaminomethyluridine(34)-2'-O)-methyltransferase TrmL [Clostridiales bacterium]